VDEREPDYRFTLANERRVLAWMRTSVALMAAGVAVVVQFAPLFGPAPLRSLVALAAGITLLGAAVVAAALG
jgi:putative membrane protein